MSEPNAPPVLPMQLDYAAARELAASDDRKIRRALAARADIFPELLYFLAGDEDAEVRAAVAANPSSPVKGNLLLTDDPDPLVRTALAEKVGQQAQPRHGSIAEQVLDRLVKDQIVEVRKILAVALKDVANADPGMINRLARDAELLVAAPVLEFSPVLTDDDLLDIIANHPPPGALSAIARRSYVDPKVTRAIVDSDDTVAITHMLKNGNAHLQESVLDSLIERSVHQPTWQEPLVYRPELTQRSALRLAELVAVHLLDRILARKDLSPATVEAVAQVVAQRLRQKAEEQDKGPTSDMIEQRYVERLERARANHVAGKLDELTLMVMLLVDPAEDIVVALAARSGLPVKVVLEMVETQAPRVLCALSWAAGLSAIFAQEMQIRIAGLPLDIVLRPTKDGQYALTEHELRWQLTVFGAAGPTV